jgi:plasmid stability protein
MTTITADFALFARTPPFARAAEALNAIRAQHGRARAAAWARSSEDDVTRICAIALMLENTKLALKLLADLERARQGGNPKKVAKVNKRLDRLLRRLGSE